MSSPVLSCTSDVTISQAQALLDKHNIYALTIVDPGYKFKGLISRVEITKALKSGNPDVQDRPVSGYMLTKVLQVSPSAPMHIIRKDMAEGTLGRAVVVDSAGRVRGMVTRTDLLRQYHFYKNAKGCLWAPMHREWVGAGAEPGELWIDGRIEAIDFGAGLSEACLG
ncbi:unnamed protein product [Discosporangium mesarthrocarpum]